MRSDVVQDNFFVDGAWQRLTRLYASMQDFTGGLFMQEPFMYNRVNGGGYFPGQDVIVQQVQILAALQFPPRFYKEDLAFNLAQIGVINNGPNARVNLYDLYYQNAVSACSTDLNIDAYQHGQASGTNIAQSRLQYIDGMDEALNDGVNPGWMGNIYSTYGNQVRNGAVGNTINSVPLWCGDQNGNPGQANWGQVTALYLNCVQAPDTLLSNKALFNYLWNREETKQRFAQETDARIGLTGFKVLDAYYHVDKLAPSTKFGTLLPAGLSQTSSVKPSTFSMPNLNATQTAISGYPTGGGQTINPGEPLFALRLKDWKIRPTTDPEYSQNFTPLIRSQQNPDLVVAWLKNAVNWYTDSPRDNSQAVGMSF